MNGPSDLIATLETLVANSNIARRADVLCEVTDLFVAGSSFFSKDQVDFFEDVMGRIIGQVTVAARSKIAAELAGVANAPTGVLRTLALDEAIEETGRQHFIRERERQWPATSYGHLKAKHSVQQSDRLSCGARQ